MADTETTTSPQSIDNLCHEWRTADARLKLECLEARDDDDAVAAASDRNTERVAELFDQMAEEAGAESWDDIYALLHLAIHVLKEGEQIAGDLDRERVSTMIGKALLGLRSLERETKGGGNG
jgi:hypothetical protein